MRQGRASKDTLKTRSRPMAGLLLLATVMAVGFWTASASTASAKRVFSSKIPLAMVGGEAITVQQFEQEMRRRSDHAGRYATLQARRELLDEMIRHQAVVVTARQEGYAEHPEVRAVVEQAMVAKFTRDRLEVLLADVTISEDEIESYYLAHQDEYTEPERVRAALILIEVSQQASSEEMLELQQQAESIRTRALESGGEAFAALARRYSADRGSRYLGGSIGWVQRTKRTLRWGDEVVDAVFSLQQPLEVGPVIRGPKGFYVIQLQERSQAQLRPLESLRAGISHELERRHRKLLRQQFYRQLETALEYEIHEELLEFLQPPEGGPPPVPGQ